MSLSFERLPEGAPGWLRDAGSDLNASRHGHCVGEMLPAGYETYLRLFHPFLPWDSVPEVVPADKRRTWRSLAAQVGAHYHGELQYPALEPALPVRNDARPYEVHEGELEPVTRRRLFAHLTTFKAPEPTFYLYDLAAVVVGNDPMLVAATLRAAEEVVGWVSDRQVAAVSTPELVWPADRSWIVCTDYDLTSTYIAAPRALAASLLSDPSLEVIEVDRLTRVDYHADELNA